MARAAVSDTFADPDTCARNELTSELWPVTPETGGESPEKLGGAGGGKDSVLPSQRQHRHVQDTNRGALSLGSAP